MILNQNQIDVNSIKRKIIRSASPPKQDVMKVKIGQDIQIKNKYLEKQQTQLERQNILSEKLNQKRNRRRTRSRKQHEIETES